MAPYIVAHLRLGLALTSGLAEENGLDVGRWGFRFAPEDRLRVFLTNTLELNTRPQIMALGEHVADEARQAELLKKERPVLVVLGNPPYDRVASGVDASIQGFLVDTVPGRESNNSLFADILDVAREHTIFSHHASLYNLYVYFWRWAMWKALENPLAPGIVSFITASSWLTGPGFVGLRKLARDQGDEMWTVDLGGDNKGANPEPNVFNIQTPVAITTVLRGRAALEGQAVAHYRKVSGTSGAEKLAAVKALHSTGDPLAGDWSPATGNSMGPLVPAGGGAAWLDMPALTDLFPWQQPGCKYGRLWPIAPHEDIIRRRWVHFTQAKQKDRAALFVTATTGRNITTTVAGMPRLADLTPDAKSQPIVRYGYRSFDRQWALFDPRVTALERPDLWASRSSSQIFLTSLMTNQLAAGPSLTVSAHVPDLHYFCGRGGKDIIPLYRDAAAQEPNIVHDLLRDLGKIVRVARIDPEDLAAYVYALLSAPRYQVRFATGLETPGPRVPLTRDKKLWKQAVELGHSLLWLHTYAERYQDAAAGRMEAVPDVSGIVWSRPLRRMPQKPSELRYDPVSQTLTVGDGTVAGVRLEVWQYEVSGMPVVKKWLGYRTLDGSGKAASSTNELDRIRMETWPKEWNDELLDLLRVLTLTLEMHPRQAALLDQICDGPLIPAAELPTPTEAERKEPKAARGGTRNLF